MLSLAGMEQQRSSAPHVQTKVDGTVTLGNSARANEAYTLNKVSAGLTAQVPMPDKKEAPSQIMSPKN